MVIANLKIGSYFLWWRRRIMLRRRLS